MTLANRNLITIDDLSNGEIEALFSLADEMSDSMKGQLGVCRGIIMASLFFEPSTRTRFSFETAMHRLGGDVITASDVGATSLSKGESIADMARVVGSYADIIVIRHPWEGAAKVVADYAGVPVINAGDGSHEHPTQTLCDLYTIKKEKQTINGLNIALYGDLKHGRTIHSLSYALARFGATIHFRSSPGLELPEHVQRKLITEYKGRLEKRDRQNDVAKEKLFPLDAIYLTHPHQLANIPGVSLKLELESGVDAFYVTRLQVERLSATEEGQELKKGYPTVDKELLKDEKYKKTLVMHPLPRVNELAHEIDGDPRSIYFKQAARGVPIRMALIALLLGKKKIDIPKEDDTFIRKTDYPLYNLNFGVKCLNDKCVSTQKTETEFIKPAFKIVSREPLILRCIYCEHEIHPRYIASSEWHQRKLIDKKYHRADSRWAKKIQPKNLIIFDKKTTAESHGYKPSQYAIAHHQKNDE